MGLSGKKVAYLIGPAFQDEEGVEPKEFLKSQGAIVTYIGPAKTTYHGKYGRQVIEADATFDEVKPEDFDLMVIPGGNAPQNLRVNEKAVEFVRRFAELKRPIAAICHGPQLLISAGVVSGRTMTCYSGMSDELKEAGAKYVDEPVVVDGNFITSRKPADIPYFNQAIAKAFE